MPNKLSINTNTEYFNQKYSASFQSEALFFLFENVLFLLEKKAERKKDAMISVYKKTLFLMIKKVKYFLILFYAALCH